MQFNESGEIRTLDRPLRRRMLYPAELPIHYSTTIFIVLYLFWHVNYFLKKVSFKQKDAFVHAWHIFLKFGLVDLGFTAGEIEAQYLQA